MGITEGKEQEAVQRYIDLLLKVSFRICHWDDDGHLKSRSSGFLYQQNSVSPIQVITAGHHTPPIGSFIETKLVYKNKTAAINAGEFNVFYNHDDIDYAYSALPLDLIRKSLMENMSFEFTIYKEPFVKAVKDEGYGFAVMNNYEFVKSGGAIVAPTYMCHEVYLELVEQDEHINLFKPARPIQLDEYYQGASGCPISDPQGRITSILIGGTDPRQFLRAFRLDNIELPQL